MGGPLCARCICNDGSDKTSSMPMHCSSSTCNYPSGQGGCPKQGNSKSPTSLVAADPTPIVTVKASATCQDFYAPCIQACGHLVKHAECYYSQGNSGPLCARCICNDGSDKTSSMPMHCSSSTCNFPHGQGGCPKQGNSKSPAIVVATDPTPIVTVKASATCQDFYPPCIG